MRLLELHHRGGAGDEPEMAGARRHPGCWPREFADEALAELT